MSKNIFFEEVTNEDNTIHSVLTTDNLKDADFVVVNDTTTIKDELNNTCCDKSIISLIDTEGIYNLRGNRNSINNICTTYYNQMKKYLEDENESIIGGITRVERKEKKNENEGFTCTNCACYPVCKFADKVDQALKELSKIGIKLTTCDYFVKYNG